MNRIHTMLLSAAVLALPVSALATPTIAFYRDGPVRSIQAGQTEDDVQSRLGNPMSTRTSRARRTITMRSRTTSASAPSSTSHSTATDTS